MHRVAVFSARHRDEDAIPVVDHAKVFDGAGHRADEAPFDARLAGGVAHRAPDCSTKRRNGRTPWPVAPLGGSGGARSEKAGTARDGWIPSVLRMAARTTSARGA